MFSHSFNHKNKVKCIAEINLHYDNNHCFLFIKGKLGRVRVADDYNINTNSRVLDREIENNIIIMKDSSDKWNQKLIDFMHS